METKKTKSTVTREIEITVGVEVKKEGRGLSIKGPKGEIKREFSNPKIKMEIKDKENKGSPWHMGRPDKKHDIRRVQTMEM